MSAPQANKPSVMRRQCSPLTAASQASARNPKVCCALSQKLSTGGTLDGGIKDTTKLAAMAIQNKQRNVRVVQGLI